MFAWSLRTAGFLVRTLSWIAVSLIAAFAGLLILPKVIDWEPYKGRLAEFLTRVGGREVAVDGPIEIALLPQPLIVARNFRVDNAPGSVAPSLFEARQLTVTLSWSALLRGRLGLERVMIVEPRLVVEPGAQSGGDWRLAVRDVMVARLEIRNGRVVHATGLSGQLLEVAAIDLSGSLDPNAGALHMSGTGVVNGVPASFTLGMRTTASAAAPIDLKLAVPGGRVVFAGWAGERTTEDPLRGRLGLDIEFLPEFVESITTASGRWPMRLNEEIARELTASADVSLAGDRLSIDDLSLTLSEERIRGNLLVAGGETLVVSGRLAAAYVDADLWVGRLQGQALFVAPAGGAGPTDVEPAKPSDEALPSVQVRLTCEAETVRYRRDSVREVAVTFQYESDVLHVEALRVVLPGDFRVNRKAGFEGDAKEAGYDGIIEFEGRNLRQTLKWIGIDTTSLPSDRLQTLRISGKTRPSKGAVHLTDASFELDDQRGTATADIAYSIPTLIRARLHLPDLNLDAYRLSRAALNDFMSVPETPPQTSPVSPPVSPPASGEPAPPVLDFKVSIDRVLYRGETAHDVDAHVVIRGNELQLKHVGVGELLGSHLEFSGSVADYGTLPRFELAYRAVVRDADRMLDFAALPRFVHRRIGAAQVAGRAAGNLKEAALSNLSVAMLGATFTAAGRVSLEDDRRFDFPRFAVDGLEIGALIAAASGGPLQELADVRADGRFHGNARRATFRGNLAVDGMALAGELSSTLDAHPHVMASLQAPGGLVLDRWLPPAPGSSARGTGGTRPGASTSMRSERLLSPLRALDATLAITAPTLGWGPFTVGTVELAAHLNRGVLEITRLAGALEGTALELTARIDARRAVPIVEIGGSVRDIDISRTMAIAGGANEFGTDQLAVALEGRFSLEDLVLRTEGNTLEELVASAVGHGQSRGDVRASVVRGSASFASFATGLAGLFSTQMGFTSAVIDGFVENWIATWGRFDLARGILALDEHTVRAPHATAYVKSRFDLVQLSVDTSIALDTGTPGSMDYLVSVRGPVAAPTLRVEPGPRR